MAKEKKKLSKSAKTAAKIVENSKLLANVKTANDAKTSQGTKPTDIPIKTGTANKMRPEKKRG